MKKLIFFIAVLILTPPIRAENHPETLESKILGELTNLINDQARTERIIKKISKYNKTILREAKKNGLDPSLVRAVMARESAGNPVAISSAGAVGLMQLMLSTARKNGCKNRYNPKCNIRAGTRYLAMLKKQFGADADAVAAYNCGEGHYEEKKQKSRELSGKDDFQHVSELLNGDFKETREFVPPVLAWYEVFKYYEIHGQMLASAADSELARNISHHHPKKRVFAKRSTPRPKTKVVAMREKKILPAVVIAPVPELAPTNNPITAEAVFYTTVGGEQWRGIAYCLGIEEKDLRGLNPSLAATQVFGKDQILLLPAGKFLPYEAGSGETMSGIADKMKVKKIDLQSWNNFWSEEPGVGQKLIIKKP